MRPIDYDVIEATYDDDPVRHDVPPDDRLGALAVGREGVRVLDVGCGTGLWLEAQKRAFSGLVVAGVDPSAGMLARARGRLPGADLRVATAEALPHDAGVFDFVASRFAYHHFRDVERALDEMARVLAPGGVLHLMNVVPQRMRGAWVPAWFAEAKAIDARYPSPEALQAWLEQRGLRVTLAFVQRSGEIAIAEALRVARARDQSHLYALDDDSYARGLAALESAAEADPSRRLPTESTLLRLYATR